MDDACKLAVSKGEAEGSPTNKTVATSLFGDREIERSQLGSPRQTFWPVAPYLLAAALFTFSSRSGLTDFGPTRRTLELARHERSFSWNWEPVSACVHGIVAPLARSSRYNKNLEFNLCLVFCFAKWSIFLFRFFFAVDRVNLRPRSNFWVMKLLFGIVWSFGCMISNLISSLIFYQELNALFSFFF